MTGRPKRLKQPAMDMSRDRAIATPGTAAPDTATPPAPAASPSRLPAFLALVAGAVAMGISPIFVRLAEVGPFASAFWRVALALPVLYAWMRLDERGEARAGAPVRSFAAATILSGIMFAGDLFFWHLAILNTTVANATFFATTAPVFVVLLSVLIYRERIAPAVLAGLGLCLAGGVALIGQSLQVAPGRILGDLYGVGTAFFFGAYFLTVQRARRTAGAARVTFELTLVTAAILAVVALALEDSIFPETWKGAAALAAMAIVSHAGGQGLLSIALGRLPAIFSSLVIFLEAVVAALFGWLVLSEALTLVQALGGALILAGIFVARPRG